jgi:hypothetical protein
MLLCKRIESHTTTGGLHEVRDQNRGLPIEGEGR